MSNGKTMSDEAKKARAEYQRKWNKAHPEAAKKYRLTYWERKAAELRDQERGKQEGK